jgi:hypothetical protein
VHDEPMLRYLRAEATQPKFRAIKFPRARAVAERGEIASRPGANDKSRVLAVGLAEVLDAVCAGKHVVVWPAGPGVAIGGEDAVKAGSPG